MMKVNHVGYNRNSFNLMPYRRGRVSVRGSAGNLKTMEISHKTKLRGGTRPASPHSRPLTLTLSLSPLLPYAT